MSYFLPPKVAEPTDPNSVKQPAQPPRTSGSFKSVAKKEDKPRIPRSSSLGQWWRNMIPSQKPERGGTDRVSDATDHQPQDGNLRKPYRRATDGRRSRRSETHDSDIFTGWNIAKDVSESNDAAAPVVSGRQATSHAAASSFQSSDNSDRKWSWVPQVQLPEHLSVKPSKPRDRKVSWQDTALEDEPQLSPDYLADRRLSNARRAIEAKKEARRQRRSLKESGDYLGVQGINPETGKLDILTPSNSDNSTDTSEFNHKIEAVKQVLKDSRSHHKNAHLPGYSDREVKRLYLKREREKRAKEQKRKQELAARQDQGLRWKRHSKQWSSAQEPALSPIAQSVRSATPSSRRPSFPFHEMSQEEQLIDLASPEQPVYTEKELPLPPSHDTSGATSKSGTVVHTRRPSGASESASLAAQELYENGISFDPSTQPSRDLTEEKAPFPFSKLSTTDSARRAHSSSEAGYDKYSFQDQLDTKVAQGSEPPKDGSFLDIPALGGPVSQGHVSGSIPRPLSTADLLSVDKSPTSRRSISLFPKRHRSAHWLNRVSPLSESPGSSSIPSSTTSITLMTPTRMRELEEEAHPLLEGSPLRRLSPTHLLQRMRKKRMQRAGTLPIRSELEPGLPMTALESLTNLNQVQQAPGHTSVDGIPHSDGKGLPLSKGMSAERKVTAVGIQEDMDFLKKEVAKVDQLNWMQDRKASDPLQTDTAWIEGTIKDITEKGDMVMDNPASTPTIITTGFDPRGSGSSQSNEGSRNRRKPSRRTAGSRKPSRTESNLASKISPQNHKQSSLLRLTPEGQIVPVDIMSMDPRPWNYNQEEEAYHSHSMSTSTSAKATEKENAAVPAMHTVISQETCGSPGQHLGEARVQVPIGFLPAVKPQALEKVMKEQTYSGQQRMTHQPPLRSPEQLLQDLIQTYPGAYPCRPGDEEDTDDPFKELKMSQTIQRLRELGNSDGNLWDAAKEFLFVVRCHVEVMLHLYWSIVGPVFDSRSQYWVRNKSGTATLLDGVAFVLAVPGAFFGLLVLV